MQSFLSRSWESCTLIWFCCKKSACNSVLEGSFCIWVLKKVGQAMLLLQSFNGSYCSSVKAFDALPSIIHWGALHFHNIISTQKLMYSDRWFSTQTFPFVTFVTTANPRRVSEFKGNCRALLYEITLWNNKIR